MLLSQNLLWLWNVLVFLNRLKRFYQLGYLLLLLVLGCQNRRVVQSVEHLANLDFFVLFGRRFEQRLQINWLHVGFLRSLDRSIQLLAPCLIDQWFFPCHEFLH